MNLIKIKKWVKELSLLAQDYQKYAKKSRMPRYQYHYRKAQDAHFLITKVFHLVLLRISRKRYCCDFPNGVKIGGGLFINHPYLITISPSAVLGNNISLSKGVTIGQENRGVRKGTPIIGNNVCICPNATIVGAIHIGDDVLIAPNAYVNCDVPAHSIVIGNPCIIKHRDNATEGYL